MDTTVWTTIIGYRRFLLQNNVAAKQSLFITSSRAEKRDSHCWLFDTGQVQIYHTTPEEVAVHSPRGHSYGLTLVIYSGVYNVSQYNHQ